MSELLTVQDEHNATFPYDRKQFYDEQITHFQQGTTSSQCIHIVNVLLVNGSWELIIQKRSHDKRHNPGLLDKSIGGHIQRWDTVDYSVMVESVQELQVPSIVIKADDDFAKRFSLLKEYLNTIALIKHIDSAKFTLYKQMQEGVIPVGNFVHIFFGVYDGAVKNVDSEAKWVLFYTLDDLLAEMQSVPQIFTDDLHKFIPKYEKELRDFIALVKK